MSGPQDILGRNSLVVHDLLVYTRLDGRRWNWRKPSLDVPMRFPGGWWRFVIAL